MALAPTSVGGTSALLQGLGQGSKNLDVGNSNLQAAGVTTQSEAQSLNHAYSTLLGVSTNAATLGQAAAAAIHQPLDGYTTATATQGSGLSSVVLGSAAVPSDFYSAPADLAPASFNSWSSGFQKEYIDRIIQSGQYATIAKSATTGTDYRIAGGYLRIGGNTGTAIDVVITPSRDASGNPIYTGGQIFIVENLTKTSLATMDNATQKLIAGYDGVMGVAAFATVATALNLNTVGGVVVDPITARTNQISAINTLISQIVADAKSNGVDIGLTNDTNPANTALVNSGALYNATTATATGGSLVAGITFTGSGYTATGNRLNDGRLLTYNDVAIFIQELLNLQKQVLNMSVFAPDSISKTIADIQSRYKTVSAFGSVPNQFSLDDFGTAAVASGAGKTNKLGFTDTETSLRVNVVSTDNADVSANATQHRYYVYRVQSWNSSDPTNGLGNTTSSYDPYIQDQVQRYNFADYPTNHVRQNAATEIHAGDWVLVDYYGNLVNFSSTPLQPLAVKGDGSNAAFIWYQKSSGATEPAYDKMSTTTDNQGTTVGMIGYSVSTVPPGTTNQTTIQSGYQKIIQAERQTLALQNQMATVASTGTIANTNGIGNKALDVPNLIFFLQLYTNLIDEQRNIAATEVVNQQNELLNAYSQMQALVNAVQGMFDSTKQTEQRDIFGNKTTSNSNNVAYSDYTADELLARATNGQATMNITSMFDKNLGKQLNPIEKLYGISRPTHALYDDGQGGTDKSICYTATAWNSFGTSLSSAVTQINQQTQIQMNNIDTLNKEKDQHFNLANNCLSKLTDILAAIGRNVN